MSTISYAAKAAAGVAAAVNGRGATGKAAPTGSAVGRTGPSRDANVPAKQTIGFNAPQTSGAKADERISFVALVLIGYRVEVTVQNGAIYEGVFSTMHVDTSGLSVVLKYARMVKDPTGNLYAKDQLAERPVPTLLLPSSDVVQILAREVKMNPADLGAAEDFGFETDAAISRGRGGNVRELQKWQPDDGNDASLFHLEADSGTGWDQFAVNRDKFGVSTTWDEHLYTTRIDRDACGITEEDAARIAREIETSTVSTGNVHLLEERGGELDPNVDEEALYGAVVRQPQQGFGSESSRARQQQYSAGGAGYRGSQQYQSRADAAPTWGRPGSGVSIVQGHGPPPPPPPRDGAPPPPPPGAPSYKAAAMGAGSQGGAAAAATTAGSASNSAPIDINVRKEVNRIRSNLTAGPKQKDQLSPFGTPNVARSPNLSSPLVTDPITLLALDLDPGSRAAKVDPATHKEFVKFKEEQEKKKQEHLLQQLKAEAAAQKEKSLSPPQDGVKEGASSSSAGKDQQAATAATTTGAPAAAGDSANGSAADGTEPASDTAATAEKKPSSKLNPFAKEFSLNINAKEFVPGKPVASAAPVAKPAAAGPTGADGTSSTLPGSFMPVGGSVMHGGHHDMMPSGSHTQSRGGGGSHYHSQGMMQYHTAGGSGHHHGGGGMGGGGGGGMHYKGEHGHQQHPHGGSSHHHHHKADHTGQGGQGGGHRQQQAQHSTMEGVPVMTINGGSAVMHPIALQQGAMGSMGMTAVASYHPQTGMMQMPAGAQPFMQPVMMPSHGVHQPVLVPQHGMGGMIVTPVRPTMIAPTGVPVMAAGMPAYAAGGPTMTYGPQVQVQGMAPASASPSGRPQSTGFYQPQSYTMAGPGPQGMAAAGMAHMGGMAHMVGANAGPKGVRGGPGGPRGGMDRQGGGGPHGHPHGGKPHMMGGGMMMGPGGPMQPVPQPPMGPGLSQVQQME